MKKYFIKTKKNNFIKKSLHIHTFEKKDTLYMQLEIRETLKIDWCPNDTGSWLLSHRDTCIEFRLSWTHEIDDTPVVNYSSSFTRRNFTNAANRSPSAVLFRIYARRFIPEKWPVDISRYKENTERREGERKEVRHKSVR